MLPRRRHNLMRTNSRFWNMSSRTLHSEKLLRFSLVRNQKQTIIKDINAYWCGCLLFQVALTVLYFALRVEEISCRFWSVQGIHWWIACEACTGSFCDCACQQRSCKRIVPSHSRELLGWILHWLDPQQEIVCWSR